VENISEFSLSLSTILMPSRCSYCHVLIGSVESDFIVALNTAQYGGGYPGPNCFKSITISYGGKTAQAKVMDQCPSCGYGDLDLSRSLFNYFSVCPFHFRIRDRTGLTSRIPELVFSKCHGPLTVVVEEVEVTTTITQSLLLLLPRNPKLPLHPHGPLLLLPLGPLHRPKLNPLRPGRLPSNHLRLLLLPPLPLHPPILTLIPLLPNLPPRTHSSFLSMLLSRERSSRSLFQLTLYPWVIWRF